MMEIHRGRAVTSGKTASVNFLVVVFKHNTIDRQVVVQYTRVIEFTTGVYFE